MRVQSLTRLFVYRDGTGALEEGRFMPKNCLNALKRYG